MDQDIVRRTDGGVAPNGEVEKPAVSGDAEQTPAEDADRRRLTVTRNAMPA